MNYKIKHGVFADMTVDYAFKRVFGSERFKAATIGLLNSIIKEREITDVEFITNEIPREIEGGKTSVIDVMCKEADGTRFVVEMQSESQTNFQQRTMYYMSKIISLYDLKAGDKSYDIPYSYMISFLNFPVEKLSGKPEIGDGYCLHYVTREQSSEAKMPASPEYYFYDLTRAPRDVQKILSDEEFWIYLLKECKNLKDIPDKLKGQPSFKAFYEGAILAGFSQKEALAYEKSMILQLDIENSKREAVEKASKESFAKGSAEGEAKGLAAGKAEAQMEIAHRLKSMGLTAEQISVATGLSADEINKLSLE